MNDIDIWQEHSFEAVTTMRAKFPIIHVTQYPFYTPVDREPFDLAL